MAGNDSSPGTAALPWRTIQKAADTLQAGDTVLIRAGTYNERVIPQLSGTAGLPITYAAHPGESPVVDGTGIAVPADEGLFHVVDRQYLRVIGLRIQHSAYAGIYADISGHLLVQGNSTYDTASSGIGIWGSADVTVEGNRVEESNGGGWQECITVAGTDTFTVRDNEVLDCHKEGICLKDGSAHGQVYRNRTRRTDSGGLYVDAWDKHTYDIDIFQNVVRETLLPKAGIGISSEQGGLLEDVRVYDNVAYGNGFAGLQVTECCIASHPMQGVVIVNNTFYGNGVGWGGGIAMDNPQAQGVVIRNNIVSQNLSFQIVVGTTVPPAHVTVDYNLIDGFGDAEGETRGSDAVEGDPRFVNAAAADFHLQATSPAIDAGSGVDAPTVDFDGKPRDGQPDIGAFEFTSAGVRTAPTDLDGDGRSDILWRETGDELHWWKMNGTAIGASAHLPPVNPAWTVSGLGDFNGDKKADILWRAPRQGRTHLWFMDGASVIDDGDTASQVGSSWVIEGVGDFDGDEKADILWRHRWGTLSLWLMNGTGLKAWQHLPRATQAWAVAALGDFNGDGNTDILWRDVRSGRTHVWLMNGASVVGGATRLHRPTTAGRSRAWGTSTVTAVSTSSGVTHWEPCPCGRCRGRRSRPRGACPRSLWRGRSRLSGTSTGTGSRTSSGESAIRGRPANG